MSLMFPTILIYISGLLTGILIGLAIALARSLYLRQARLRKIYRLDREFDELVNRSILEVEQATGG